MDKYVFIFSNGAVILAKAENKKDAINNVMNEFTNLFESNSFSVNMVSTEIDEKGNIVTD